MASVITTAFENWKAQEAASGKAVLLDEFVFANVPNLDPTKPIDRNEKLPPANQIVHRQAVNKAGLASENAVAYSVTMGADVGNFDFNWIGLLNKASGTVAMITHAPTQKKLKNQNGQQGNVLTRSFLLEFQGAAEETQIKTSAETWQIDFTARLSGIDEMQRLINVDSYGAAAFFDESFEVTRSGEQYSVKKGLGYVGGLRGELAQNQILNGLRNTKVYADFSYQGNIVSQWNTVVKITSAAALNNYVDAAGFTHQVFAIASIDASGNVKDLRPIGALSAQEISALEARFKLDLSKKIDKANITDQTGNSGELVASQRMVTTELGKKQPVGVYVTPTELSSKLNDKFDKTGGIVTGVITATQRIESGTGDVRVALNSYGAVPDILSRRAGAIYHHSHKLPDASGTLMQVGDYGLGATSSPDAGLTKDWGQNGFFFGRKESDNSVVFGISCNHSNSAYSFNLYTRNGHVFFITKEQGISSQEHVIYSTRNTKIDRNGYLKTSTNSEDMQSIPIGSSVIWNSTAPIPENFWPNEGRSFSATEYPELAKTYPNLKLPDDRGYAIRIADNGRGIDAGRTVGTYQDDAMQKIVGSLDSLSTADSSSIRASGAFTNDGDSPSWQMGVNNRISKSVISFDSGRVTRTANETRMKNVAKILITRVK
ncbi:phage tail protein [Providencia rettgeri]